MIILNTDIVSGCRLCKKSKKYPKEMLNSNSSACSWPLKAALTFCPGFPSCDKLVEQTKADQHLQGAAFHTWVEAEDGPLMTHSPPSHLEWTRSAGNRPETQPPHGPETWWCLPACLPNKSYHCRERQTPDYVSIIQTKHDWSMLFTEL